MNTEHHEGHLGSSSLMAESRAPSMAEVIAAALDALEDNDNHAATVILKTAQRALGVMVEDDTRSEAEKVCHEAYQVVGSLLSDLGKFGTPEADKILDNLSSARLVHKDVLPWDSYEPPQDSPPSGR